MLETKTVKPYFSERTIELINEREYIKISSYGRRNKNKKTRDLILKNTQIQIHRCSDFILESAKNPVACTFMILTVGLASFIFFSTLSDVKLDRKFFNAMENDSTIPKEMMLRVQNHYYNSKK